MKRKVEIESVGSSGVILKVTFTGVPCIKWPYLNAEYTTLSPGAPGVRGQDYFIKVVSLGFRNVAEAKLWLDKLTTEVMEVAGVQQENIELFKELEGEISI